MSSCATKAEMIFWPTASPLTRIGARRCAKDCNAIIFNEILNGPDEERQALFMP